MGDITAADVTARVRSYSNNLVYEAGQAQREVLVEVTINLAGGNKTYDTVVGGGGAGIPLTNLFTAGNASDTGLDFKYPIYGMGSWLTEANALDDEALGVRFINGGVTAATQKLMLLTANGAAAATAALVEVPDGTDLDAAIALPGATSATCMLRLNGRARIGV